MTYLQVSDDGLSVIDGKVRCPVCDKDIKVGMGGVQNFRKQHNPGVSKACSINKKKAAATHQPTQPSGPHATNVISVPSSPTRSPAAIKAPAIKLLAKLETAIKNVPALPDASEADEITAFSQRIPTDLDKDDAWEYLDPMLNRFLGFDRSVERISEELRGGDMGLAAMMRYLKEFVGLYQIDIGLLEGKMQRLLEAIQLRCVLTRQ